ncbi:MAG: 50S ribosomal protein L10 [Candidatus Peregrinibacteria bacterium]
MPVTKEKKSTILSGLIDQFSRSKTVVFSGYRGLGMKGMSDLRKRLRSTKSDMKIAKKTLMKLAAKENKLGDIPDSILEGPVAVIFSYEDELSGLQALFKFSKENENVKLLGGIIDGKLVDAETVKKYAKLPTRQELLAKFLGSAQSPVTGFVGILHNLVAGFVRALDAYKDKRSGETPNA